MDASGGPNPALNPADRALLDALPIAAGVVGRHDDGAMWLVAWNGRLEKAVRSSNDDIFDPADMALLREGQISGVLRDFLDGNATGAASDELEFRDGDGVGARHFRMKLAPLPSAANGSPRCLVSLVDRTVEVRAER